MTRHDGTILAAIAAMAAASTATACGGKPCEPTTPASPTVTAVETAVEEAPAPTVGHYSFFIDSKDDLWLHTGVEPAEGDLLVIQTRGKIVVYMDAEGKPVNYATPVGYKASLDCITENASGAVIARFGDGQPFCVRENFAVRVGAEQSGDLRLKVLDGNYTNNDGNFDVAVFHTPAALLSEATTVERVLKADEAEGGVIQGSHREEGKRVLEERAKQKAKEAGATK